MGITLLKKVHYLKHLPDGALQRLSKIAKIKRFREGEIVFSQKEAGNDMFIVAEGKISIYLMSSSRKQKTFAVMEKGDFFGELALLEGSVRTASAKALVDSSLLVVSKNDFKRFLMSDPKFMMLLLRTMAERLRKANEEISGLLFKNLLGRVAKSLYTLVEKSARQPENGGGVATAAPLMITHHELAAWVGTSREPLSRALGVLRRGGLIDTQQGRIVVTDLEKLKKVVEG